MPNYEFKCPAGHLTERRMLFTEMVDWVQCSAPVQHYPLGPESEPEVENCGAGAKRQLSSTFLIVNPEVMYAQSKRMRGRGGS